MRRLEPEVMNVPGGPVPPLTDDLPIIAIDMPVMYEDEGQENMGESIPHTASIDILFHGMRMHFAAQTELAVLSNLNVYYHRIDRWAYFSPDVMVVRPTERLSDRLRSYRIGKHGPAPLQTIEVLSARSFQQQDLHNKPTIYSQLGIAEYILVDATGEFMEQKLLLKRLQDDGVYKDEQDSDGAVTSKLGFRIVIDADEGLRIINAATGQPYLRPDELEAARAAEASARQAAEQRVRELEAELARLKGKPSADQPES